MKQAGVPLHDSENSSVVDTTAERNKAATGGIIHLDGGAAVEESKVLRIPLYQVRPFKTQPRGYFNPVTMQELSASMRAVGQLTPGIVKILMPPVGDFKYELVDGERRLKACGMAQIPHFRGVLDTEIHDEKTQFEKSAIANFCREDHPPIEVARMIERFSSKEFGYSYEQIALRIGRSVAYVRQYHSLLQLHEEVLKLLDPSLSEDKQLTVTTAFRLVKFPPQYQVRLAQTISTKGLKMNEARHVITQASRKAGIETIRRPDVEFDIMAGFFERTKGQLQLFTDLDEEIFRRNLSGRDLQARMALQEDLEDVIAHATALKKLVDLILAEAPAQK